MQRLRSTASATGSCCCSSRSRRRRSGSSTSTSSAARSSLDRREADRLEAAGGERARPADAPADRSRAAAGVRAVAQPTDASVTVLGVRDGQLGAGLRRRRLAVRAHAMRRATSPRRTRPPAGSPSSAVERVDGGRVGQTAIPLERGGEPRWARGPVDAARRRRGQRRADPAPDPDRRRDRPRRRPGGGLVRRPGAPRRLRRLERRRRAGRRGRLPSTQIPIDSTDEVGQLAR